MINGLVLHDYENCIANLPNSILKNYGVNPVGKTLSMADHYLKDDYKNVVILLTKEAVYKEKLFGTGKPHVNADAMIGDYLAVSMTNLTIFNTSEEAKAFKGVHAGYTHEEMTVPFIVFDSNK